MGDIRESILNNTFNSFKNEFLSNYHPTDEIARMAQKKQWLESRNITQY